MKFVESFDLFGTNVSQIACIRESGAPTTATEGAVGCLYMNTNNGAMYKCTAVADGVYTWKPVESGSGGGGAVIDDEDISADKTWSSHKISDYVWAAADEYMNHAFYNMLLAAIDENVEGTMDAIYAGVVARLTVYNGEVV